MQMTFSALAEAAGGKLLNAQPESSISAVETDSRKDLSNALFIAIPGEKFDGHDFLSSALANGAALLCVEEKSIAKLPAGAPALAVKDSIRAYQAIASAWKRSLSVKTIALTGSCGKTSTKEMLRSIMEKTYGAEHVLATEGNTNNQIGVPQNLLRLTPEHKVCVIEAGTNHHGEIEPLSETIRPDAALIVSIGRCHLENLGSLDGVAREKSKLFKYLAQDGTAVIPASARGKEIMLNAAEGRRIIEFGTEDSFHSEYLGGDASGSSFILYDGKGGSAEIKWRLSGSHQADNAAGAAAAASALGIPFPVIAAGLADCTLPGMRMKVTDIDGIRWINDAYNANPESMKAALAQTSEFTEPSKTLLVLGDMLETGRNETALHAEVLNFAFEKFHGASFALVGRIMKKASDRLDVPERVFLFKDSKECAENIKFILPPQGGTVFLKASRGTRLELVIPEEK